MNMHIAAGTRVQRPWTFFALVVALSAPFWAIGSATGIQLVPGLPISAFSAFSPALAAIILRHHESGREGVAALLRRATDFGRIRNRGWYLAILTLMPAVTVASYIVMRLSGVPLPRPDIPVATAAAIFAAALVLGVGEELGWSGYALGPLQERWGALPAALILGLVWAVWHLPPLVQVHRPAEWIAWWWLGTMAQRVLMGWLFNNTGQSVFGASLYHAMINVTWLLFPVLGSHYDPRVTNLIVLAIATTVTAITGAKLGYGASVAV
ncbi:MAG: CPBP family intramembrane glutamic endopeptidase [Isosphaeraceae bacterium]